MRKKTISFKVDEDVYNALKKKLRSKKRTFRSIFEPLAVELARNNSRGLKYTGGIPKNSDDLYISLNRIKKDMEDLFGRYKK